MKVKYNDLTAAPIWAGDLCARCCFYSLGELCIRDKFTDLGPCISKRKYYTRFPKSDIFEL